MDSERPAVFFADMGMPWEAFTILAAGLRKRGFDTYRATTVHEGARERLSLLANHAVYSKVESTVSWPGGTSPVDVSAVELAWMSNVVDVQATDRVGSALVDAPGWRLHPGLHRVPTPIDEQRLYDKYAQMQDAQRADVAIPATTLNPADIAGDRVVVKQRLQVVVVTLSRSSLLQRSRGFRRSGDRTAAV